MTRNEESIGGKSLCVMEVEKGKTGKSCILWNNESSFEF